MRSGISIPTSGFTRSGNIGATPSNAMPDFGSTIFFAVRRSRRGSLRQRSPQSQELGAHQRSRAGHDRAGASARRCPSLRRAGFLETPDGRYIVVRGRLWRKSNPNLGDEKRDRLVHELMDARRAVKEPEPMKSRFEKLDLWSTRQRSGSVREGPYGGRTEVQILTGIWRKTRRMPNGTRR